MKMMKQIFNLYMRG